MSPRLFCNVVYARLLANCGDEKGRAELERDLYAPLEGWDAAQQRMWDRIADAAGPDDDEPESGADP